jgi:hypothetical protein
VWPSDAAVDWKSAEQIYDVRALLKRSPWGTRPSRWRENIKARRSTVDETTMRRDDKSFENEAKGTGISLRIRKWFQFSEETHLSEMGQAVDGEPVRKHVIAATIANPYAKTFGTDLRAAIAASEQLGVEFGQRIVEIADGEPIQSYGKACIVGTNGEYEHGNALLTSLFANPIREAIGGGKAWVPSTGKRGGPGVTIDIPLAHKDALYVRSHYDTVTMSFADAPAPDEIVIIFAVATRGRPHARCGGLKAAQIKGLDGLY